MGSGDTHCAASRGVGCGDASAVVDALGVDLRSLSSGADSGRVLHRAATRTGQRLEYIGDAELAEALKGLVEGTPLW